MLEGMALVPAEPPQTWVELETEGKKKEPAHGVSLDRSHDPRPTKVRGGKGEREEDALGFGGLLVRRGAGAEDAGGRGGLVDGRGAEALDVGLGAGRAARGERVGQAAASQNGVASVSKS